MTTAWREELYDMGIPDHIIDLCGLQSVRDGVTYPCQYPPIIEGAEVNYPVTRRTKYFASARQKNRRLPKYSSETTDSLPGEKLPPLYVPDWNLLLTSIRQAEGLLELFEGEPDVWARFASGHYNASGILGNGAIGEDLLVALNQLGVRTLRYYPDADNGGWDGAERLKQLLGNSSNVKLEILVVPPYWNGHSIKDIRDLWLAVDGNPVTFDRALSQLKPLKVRDDSKTDSPFQPELYRAIENALGLTTVKEHAWNGPVACPFGNHEHDDHSPSAYWHPGLSILRCFKCGRYYLTKEVADALNLDYHQYVLKGATVTEPTPLQQLNTSEIRVAASLLTATNGIGYEAQHWGDFMYPLTRGLDHLQGRLLGTNASMLPAVPFPFQAPGFRKLGGYCDVLVPPMMMGLLGLSGGFKSSFVTAFATRLAAQGYNVIIWSPEWSPEKHADRIIQGQGGLTMTQVSLLERFYYEQRMEELGQALDEFQQFGLHPGEEAIRNALGAIGRTRDVLKGEIVYLNQFGANILEVLAMLRAACDNMRSWGKPAHVFIMDYVQLANPPKGPSFSNWSVNDTITLTKAMTLGLGLVSLVVSQVRKSDTEAAGQGELLSSVAGQNFRDDQINLGLTLSPTPERIGNYRVVKCVVTKNSLGRARPVGALREDPTGQVDLYVDERRMVIMDELPET